MKHSTEGRRLRVIKTPEFQSCEFPKETVQAGLKILAKIIAREAVKEQRTKSNSIKLDSSASVAVPAKISTPV
jgi:hypothetical protein